MKKFEFTMDGKKIEIPNSCEETTIRTGRDEEFVFEALGCYDGPIDFSVPQCRDIESDLFESFPDQFDAIFCGVEYEMMMFQYGAVRISTPIENFKDKVRDLKHGDLVTIRIR